MYFLYLYNLDHLHIWFYRHAAFDLPQNSDRDIQIVILLDFQLPHVEETTLNF